MNSLDSPPALAAPGSRQIPLNVLFGVPDDGAEKVRVSPDGRKLFALSPNPERSSFQLRGSANLAPFLSPERFALNRFYLQGGTKLRLNLGPGPILNHIADPDICAEALAIVAQITERAQRPCFNHPAAVLRTSRDGVARLLAGIPGLTVPKTVRVTGTSPDEVRATAANAGLGDPILARVTGSHGGKERIRIDHDGAFDALSELNRSGRPLYLTEFRDFVSPDGFYRKYRIVVVGEGIFLRQCIVGTHWSLHGGQRAAETDQEEAHAHDTFATEWLPAIEPVFREIARRLELDFFGVDCNIDSDRQVLLFEANPCMKIMKNYRPLPNRLEAPIAKIKTAVEDRLASPATWLHSPT